MGIDIDNALRNAAKRGVKIRLVLVCFDAELFD